MPWLKRGFKLGRLRSLVLGMTSGLCALGAQAKLRAETARPLDLALDVAFCVHHCRGSVISIQRRPGALSACGFRLAYHLGTGARQPRRAERSQRSISKSAGTTGAEAPEGALFCSGLYCLAAAPKGGAAVHRVSFEILNV